MTQQRYTPESKTWYLVPPQGGQWVMDGDQRRVFSGEVVIDANGYLTDTEGNFLFSEETNGYVTAAETQLTPVSDVEAAPAVQEPVTQEAVVEETPAEQEVPAEVAEPAPVEPEAAEPEVAEPEAVEPEAPALTKTAVVPPVTAPTITETAVVPQVILPATAAPAYANPVYTPQNTQPPTQQFAPNMGAVAPNTTNTPAVQEGKATKEISLPIAILITLLAAGVGAGVGWLLFYLLG